MRGCTGPSFAAAVVAFLTVVLVVEGLVVVAVATLMASGFLALGAAFAAWALSYSSSLSCIPLDKKDSSIQILSATWGFQFFPPSPSFINAASSSLSTPACSRRSSWSSSSSSSLLIGMTSTGVYEIRISTRPSVEG